MKIGFIGLGNVGGKLAGSLLRNKFNITVIDLDDNLVKDFVSKGSATAKSPKELTEKVYRKFGKDAFRFLIEKPPSTRELKEPELYLKRDLSTGSKHM